MAKRRKVPDPAKPQQIFAGLKVWCTIGRCAEWVGDRSTGLDATPTGDPDRLSEFDQHCADDHGIVFPSKRSLEEARRIPAVERALAEAKQLHRGTAEAIERARRGYKHAGLIGFGDVDDD